MPTKPNQIDLLVDTEGGKLIRNFTSTKTANPPIFTFGDDGIPITVRLLRKSTANPDFPWSEVVTSDKSVQVGIGSVGATPTAGTFKLTFESTANTTIDLAYNATAANVQTELNKLASITADGGVTVIKPGDGLYRVLWDDNGARALMTANAAPLYPTSIVQVLESVTGDASTREAQLVHLETNTAAYLSLDGTTNALPSAAVTITEVRKGVTASSTSEIQKLDLSDPEPFDGTYTLQTNTGPGAGYSTSNTAPLAWNASAATIQAALRATNSTWWSTNIAVTGAFPEYKVEFSSYHNDVPMLVGYPVDLKVPTGVMGDLDASAAGFRELLGGSAKTTATLEIQVTNTTVSTAYTPIQTPCVVRDDLISL